MTEPQHEQTREQDQTQQDEPPRIAPKLYEEQPDGFPPQSAPPAGDRTPTDPREDQTPDG